MVIAQFSICLFYC